MESVEELRRALEAARAETAALRATAEGADRAPRGNDTGDAGEADSAYRATYDDGYYAGTRAAGTRADGHAGPNARQGANTANVFWGGRNRQILKFPRNEDGAIRSTVGAGRGRGCNTFVPVLGGNGTKIAPTGDIFDQPPGQMR